MAFDAVLIVVDTLFTMYLCHLCQRVFVAVVAGIFFIIAGFCVACLAACAVIPVEPEVTVMVECGWFPAGGAMACRTVRF